jgi:hypothetical protein
MNAPSPYLHPDHQLNKQLRAMARSRKDLTPEQEAKLDEEMEAIKGQIRQNAMRHMQETGVPIITEEPPEA